MNYLVCNEFFCIDLSVYHLVDEIIFNQLQRLCTWTAVLSFMHIIEKDINEIQNSVLKDLGHFAYQSAHIKSLYVLHQANLAWWGFFYIHISKESSIN